MSLTEEWRSIPGYPGYHVSDEGRVRRSCPGGPARTGRIKAQRPSNGRYNVTLSWKGRKSVVLVHRLVAFAFDWYPGPGYEVAHWDGDPSNNVRGNIRWATASENWEDKRRHGRATTGERHGGAKLSHSEVEEIRRLAASGVPQRKIATQFGIHQAQVHRIHARKNWQCGLDELGYG